MAQSDSHGRTFPVKITTRTKELGNSAKLNAFQKQTARAFQDLERAIGDLRNTENATRSPLAGEPLYINSLGRAVGSMASIVPPLTGLEEYSPTLAARLANATYNTLPHPDQAIRCEVGCRYDTMASDTATARSCIKGQDAFYRQKAGPQTGICQNTACPSWSGHAKTVDATACDPAAVGNTYRDYKIVQPPELREIDRYAVAFYSNCGTQFDRYRTDSQSSGYGTDRSVPAETWASTSASSSSVDTALAEIRYEYPNLNAANGYLVVVEIPALDTEQAILVNGVQQTVARGTSSDPTRWLFDLSSLTGVSRLTVGARPATAGGLAAISQIWVIEKTSTRHRNYGEALLLPIELDNLTAGTAIPLNFLQVFDTDPAVNRMLDNVQVYAARFNPKSVAVNGNSHRDSFDVRIFGDQQLEIGNTRYLGVTVGTSVAETVGALLDAFIEHVADASIHLDQETICQLVANPQFCCENTLRVSLETLTPPTRTTLNPPATYDIRAYIYGGNPPYTVTIDWGDNSSDPTNGVVSGVQVFELSSDVHPSTGIGESFAHVYQTSGTFPVTFDVMDDPTMFGCEASLTSQVSPFNVGAPPVIDPEIRLDYATSYPNFAFLDITAGYNFLKTEPDDWTSNPRYHVLTQVHNTDFEDGKPREFSWQLSNPGGLTFQLYYEKTTQVLDQAIVIANSSGYLGQTLVQQDSVALVSGSRAYVQETDFTVDWETGWLTVTGSSIPSAANLTASYHYYADAINAADVANQWVTLGAEQSAAVISISDLTSDKALNTIRFKVKE